ncbi:hypothetical protein EVAR_53282_1 [Eumeta japonica]|uniref:Uncharacterized protein n=1 Tax=Eumeta variegata TaxID=151549 RepID=A0A4C1YVD0_EUMVA|nr:hypothetical protein EVAR_53282_1 [Eumeta japonica]
MNRFISKPLPRGVTRRFTCRFARRVCLSLTAHLRSLRSKPAASVFVFTPDRTDSFSEFFESPGRARHHTAPGTGADKDSIWARGLSTRLGKDEF